MVISHMVWLYANLHNVVIDDVHLTEYVLHLPRLPNPELAIVLSDVSTLVLRQVG